MDDNLDAAHSLQHFLSNAGFEVQLAHDGPTALEMVRNDQPDAVVLDIGLPHLDGNEVARRLRDEMPIPIIALTGYAPNPEAGSIFDRYLLKPAKPDELVDLLAELMGS